MKTIIQAGLTFVFAVLVSFSAQSQSYTMGAAGAQIIECGGTILDPGGTGNYADGLDVTQTICAATPGECLSLTFTSFGTENCCDYLRIYDGPSIAGDLLGEWRGTVGPGTVISSDPTTGCLTLVFHSDGSVTGIGFSATISCAPCPPTITLGENGGTTITGCSGVLRDPGGSGNYPDNANVVHTFCSGTGECVSLSFESFATEANVDMLNVYDGSSTADQLISTYSGTFAAPPAPVQSSSASGGCMTLEFISNANTNLAGFRANISCVPCEPPPLILGNGNVVVCSGELLDPGGTGNYPNNANFVQTICSGNNQCVSIQFNSFATEAGLDRLRVYDGPTTTADIIAVYSGAPFTPPAPVSSSTASGGCITLEFTSNGAVNNSGFEAVISCVPCQDPVVIPTGFCDDALPFCSDLGQTFPAATNAQSEFGGPIGCLGSTPNPAWYFLKVETSGTLDMQIQAASDIDFICWGPFTELEWQNGVCNTILDPVWAGNQTNIIDCSYSGTNDEDFVIPNAIADEYYAVLITNFSNQDQNISFTQDAGSGSTDCSILCQNEITGGPTACDPATNTYSVTGTVTLSNPPNTGTLLIENSTAGFDIYNAPFPAVIPFNYTNISSDGAAGSVTVSFSDDGTCVTNVNYTAPATCSSCPVTATVSGPACEGQNITLSASNVANGQYTWIGPNGFASNQQNPVLTNVTPAMAGVYQVTALNPMNNCSSISSVNVFVFATPAAPVIANSGPVCEGLALNLTADPVPAGTFAWTGPNNFTSGLQNPTIAATTIASDGVYSCTVSVNGCVSPATTTTAVINPYPATPVPSNNGPLCDGDNLQLNTPAIAGATYEWSNPALAVFSGQQSPQLNAVVSNQSGTYSLRVQVNGCWSLPGTTDVFIFPIPATPTPVSNSPVCQFSEITITGPNPLPVVGTTYAWSGPNLFSAATQNVSILNAQQIHAGQYSLVITENGCSSAVGQVAVAVTDIPVSDAGADLTVCSGQPAQLGAAAVPGYNYSWNPTLGIDFATISNPTAIISNFSPDPRNEMYIVTTTELGCTSRDTVIITINPQPVASFVAPDPQCFSGNISDFEAEGIYSGNATFDWQFGPWATPVGSTDPNPQGVTFNSTGVQIVTLVVTDRGCESNPYQAPVMIYKMPVANFVSDFIEGCDPKVINFLNLSEGSDNNTIKTYGWTFGNGRASTVVDPIVLYNDAGSYDVSLTVTNERGCVDVYTIPNMIRIFPSPQAEFSLEPPMAYIVKPEIEVYNFAVGGNEVYYVINGVDTIYQAEPKLIFSDSGTYNVRQIVVSSDGCMDSITKPAYIELGYKVYVPTAFTPNADGYNDLFKAYGEDIKEFSMLIYNRWGELLYSSFDYENGWDGRNRLNDEPAPGGVYVYKISTVQRNGLIGNYEGTVVLLR